MNPLTPNIKSLNIITWNISGLDISDHTPLNIDLSLKWDLIRQILEEYSPDILILQELPNRELATIYSQRLNLIPVYMLKTHLGITILCLPKDWRPKITKVINTQAVIGCLVDIDNESWGIAAIHLPPTKNAAKHREKQLTTVIKYFDPKVNRIIIGGDTNMRKAENKILPKLDLQDAFFLANSPKTERWTWDSYKNPYHNQSFQFTVRFDRIFIRKWKVQKFQLIGNTPIESDCYLSDHFGIVTTIVPE